MTATLAYTLAVTRLIAQFESTQLDAVERAAEAAAESITHHQVLHVFGSGHSQLVAMEATARAGGLAAVNCIADPALDPRDARRVSLIERLHGYAAVTLELGEVRAGQTLIVISNSGINPVPIEMAVGARQRGLTVVAISSLPHSLSNESRHRSTQRLHDVVDIVIDTGAPPGDTTVDVNGIGTGAVSTLLGTLAINALTVRAIELLSAGGHQPPVLISQNVTSGGERSFG